MPYPPLEARLHKRSHRLTTDDNRPTKVGISILSPSAIEDTSVEPTSDTSALPTSECIVDQSAIIPSEVQVDANELLSEQQPVLDEPPSLDLNNHELKDEVVMSDSTVITPGSGQAVITTGDSDDSKRFWENTILREVNANFRELFESVTTNATADAAAFKDAQATAYLVEGRINVQAALNAAAIQVQAEKLAAASVLQASQNTATVQAAIAKCCCETQEQIIASSQAVLNRMNEIEIARQATLLSDEKQKVLVLQAQVIALGATPAASARIA
jgi:hypothetical protein